MDLVSENIPLIAVMLPLVRLIAILIDFNVFKIARADDTSKSVLARETRVASVPSM